MARSTGAHHADLVKGSTGALTHRVYRGVGTVSRHRQPSRVRLRSASINSPHEIPDCFSRFNAGILYSLRNDGLNNYLTKLIDIEGGFGYLQQTIPVNQPSWFASDPAHNAKPYILPDGISDYLVSPNLLVPFTQPLDIWIIASDCGTPVTRRVLFSLHPTIQTELYCGGSSSIQWRWTLPIVDRVALWSNSTVKIWRLVLSPTTVELFWNGISQNSPQAITPLTFKFLQLFAAAPVAYYYNYRLFEIAFWRRILNPVEAGLLLKYYNDTFNVF